MVTVLSTNDSLRQEAVFYELESESTLGGSIPQPGQKGCVSRWVGACIHAREPVDTRG